MELGGQRHPPFALPPGKTRYPLYEAGWASGPVWTDAENLASTGILSPDRPNSSELLYRSTTRVCVCVCVCMCIYIYMFTEKSIVYPDVKSWPCFDRSAYGDRCSDG
jgi:hypothetical protein